MARYDLMKWPLSLSSGEHRRLSPCYDPILGNNALDRLANASYQIVIEGSSYRERLSLHRKLRGLEEVIDRLTGT